MKQFDYTEKWKKLLTPEIVSYLTTIHEYKGKQHLIAERHADVLENLVEIAKIQSTESSNKIEGIYTSDERLKKIVLDKTMPKTRNEREIAGYRDVLNTIHENFQHIAIHLYYSYIEIYINSRIALMEEDSRQLIILLRKKMKGAISLLGSDHYLHGRRQTQSLIYVQLIMRQSTKAKQTHFC